MDDHPTDGPLVLTNELIHGKNGRATRIVAVFLGLIGVGLLTTFLLLARSQVKNPTPLWAVLIGLGTGIFFLYLANTVWTLAALRIWALSPEGISCRGPLGVDRGLRWREVERVRWTAEAVHFHGRGARIELPWRAIPPKRLGDTRKRISEFLPGFDLPLGGKPSWKAIALCGLSIAWFFLSFCLSFLLVFLLLGDVVLLIERQGWDDETTKKATMCLCFPFWHAMILPLKILFPRKEWYSRECPSDDQCSVAPQVP